MNINYIKLIHFIEKYNAGEVEVPDEIIQEFLQHKYDLVKGKKREFRLSISNIGRPACQLQYEKLGVVPEKQAYNAALRNAMGNFSELWLVMMMKAADLNVSDFQKSTHIIVKDKHGRDHRINGKLDITLDDRIYDVKTASKYAFRKYSEQGGIHAISEEDSFGYIAQGFGYAKGEGKPFGGWWVINKDNGQIALCEINNNYEKYERDAEKLIQDNLNVVLETTKIEDVNKLFVEVEEKLYGKETGNKKLGPICSMCPFKKNCWPTVKYLPNTNTNSKTKTYNWYTVYRSNDISKDENNKES